MPEQDEPRNPERITHLIGAGSQAVRAKRLQGRSSGKGPGDVEDLVLWQVQQIEKAIIEGKAAKAERAADCFPLRRAKTVANFEVQISIARQFHKAKGRKKQDARERVSVSAKQQRHLSNSKSRDQDTQS